MIADIHAHVIPGVDDGARDMKEAAEILKMMRLDGITSVVATPHYYPQISPEPSAHIKVIKAAFDNMLSELQLSAPNIILGHEVHYFRDIARSEQIRDLRMGNSEYILLELPFDGWGYEMEEEIISLALNTGLTPIIAHIERYMGAKGIPAVLETIKRGYAVAQLSCDALLYSRHSQKNAIKLLKSGVISYIATDAHSVDKRPPRMSSALKTIESKLGSDAVEALIKNANELFRKISEGQTRGINHVQEFCI